MAGSGSGAGPFNRGFRFRKRIGPAEAGEQLLSYLTRAFPHSSPEEWLERVLARTVEVDGRTVEPDFVLLAGQELTWHRPPWREPDAPLSFAVLFQDDHVLAVAKPPGLPTLPGAGYLEHTLLHQVRRCVPGASPVHRLGRWTSGIVLFARTRRARAAMAGSLRDGVAHKRYRALATGHPRHPDFNIDVSIGPVPHPRLGTVHAASPRGNPASTRVVVLEQRAEGFLADVFIATGRPHQIRIHLAAAGHPLVGDPLYGCGGIPATGCDALPGDPGYRLHAAEIRLPHPATAEDMVVRCGPPPDLRKVTERDEP